MDDPCVGLACATMHKHATVEKHPLDSPVPNFGADTDMETNMRSLEIAEEKTGKKLIMGTPESKL